MLRYFSFDNQDIHLLNDLIITMRTKGSLPNATKYHTQRQLNRPRRKEYQQKHHPISSSPYSANLHTSLPETNKTRPLLPHLNTYVINAETEHNVQISMCHPHPYSCGPTHTLVPSPCRPWEPSLRHYFLSLSLNLLFNLPKNPLTRLLFFASPLALALALALLSPVFALIGLA